MSRWKNCCIEGCVRIATAKGLCEPHYKRLMKTGDLRPALPIRSLERKQLWTNR